MPTPALEIRTADRDQYAEIGDLTARTYLAEGYGDEGYGATLRDVTGRALEATVLVALDGGSLVGSVTVATRGGRYAEVADAGEAVVRMLVVAPEARGRGAGTALVQACLDRARADACLRVRLSTQPTMTSAHRIYEGMGFRRTPERDWQPVPGLQLVTYVLDLAPAPLCDLCGRPGAHEACRQARELEPPRYCPGCGRRLVVQVTPGGWTARCVEHGVTSG